MTRRYSFTPTSFEDFVYEVWGIKLLAWQREDMFKFVVGGIFSWSIPTDHGKSSGVEIVHCCRLCEDPNRRQLAIKSNDTTAQETTVEVARRLRQIADGVTFHGGPMFEWVEPQVTWRGMRGDEPYGVRDGFDVVGVDRRMRNPNRSFRGYGIGDRDLQGKRGDTSIDDVETLEHADSQAEQRRLSARMDGIVRTLEADPVEVMWVIVGTAMHEESVYNQVTDRLGDLPIAWERIERPFRNADGSYLWPERGPKIEIHRQMMSKRAWAVGYELRLDRRRALTPEEIRQAVREVSMPWVDNQRDFVAWFLDWAMQNGPPYTAPTTWRKFVEERIEQELRFYICWDPATEGDWAIVTLAMWGDYVWVLRCTVDDTDTFEQMMTVKDQFLDFPKSTLILETNGQQKVFLDVAREDDVLKQVPYVKHTSQGKRHPQAGLPAMMEFVRKGYLRCPWGDEARASLEFDALEREAERYGPTAHPHALMAVWFGWRYHRRSRVGNSIRTRIAREELKRQTAGVAIKMPQPVLLPLAQPGQGRQEYLRQRSQAAWARRHR